MNIQVKNKLFRSLRSRIVLLLLVVGIIPAFIIICVLLYSYKNQAINTRVVEVQSQAKVLADQIANSSYLTDPSLENMNTEIMQMSNIFDGRIMVIDSNFKIIRDTYDIEEGKTIISEEVIRCFKGEEIVKHDGHNHYIEMTIAVADPKTRENIGILLISSSTDAIMAAYENMVRKAEFLGIFFLAVLILLSAVFSKALVMPFSKISKTMNEFKEGFAGENIEVFDYTETESISNAFNAMMERIKAVDDSRQEFVSNVSHELKTPITSMKVLADSLLAQDDVPNELYKEFMQDIADEIERENKIITDLLTLVRMDKSAATLNIETVSINDLLELILKRLRPIAQERNIELVFESFRPVNVEVDEVKMTQAFTNLIENAIKYNKDNGWVHVSLNADHKYFFVEVADSGIGIPEDELEHIFERFYRVDKSHSTEISGNGLGLAIARNAILMHRGAVKVHSKENSGTTFNVRVPINYVV